MHFYGSSCYAEKLRSRQPFDQATFFFPDFSLFFSTLKQGFPNTSKLGVGVLPSEVFCHGATLVSYMPASLDRKICLMIIKIK